MIVLISNDDQRITFTKEEGVESPYISDAFWDKAELDADTELPVPLASGSQLSLLKLVIAAKLVNNGSFIPWNGPFILNGRELPSLPFTNPVWNPELHTIMMGLNEGQIVELLCLADSMCMWSLREGVATLILHRMIKGGWKFSIFFDSAPNRIKECIATVYQRFAQ